MIHNIPIDMVLSDFRMEEVFDSNYHNFRYEKGRKKTDSLFELGKKIVSSLR